MSQESRRPAAEGTESERPGALSRPRGRVLGDAEIARILQTAADLQERSDAFASTSAHGLTIEDLRQVAHEAGIDPKFVDIAVNQGRGPVGRQKSLLLGGPQSWRFHSEIPGDVTEEARSRLVQAVRSVMDEKGEVAEVYGRLEWRHDDTLGPVSVGISPGSGTTEIDVSANRQGEAGLIFGLGVPAGGMLGGAVVANLIGVAGTIAALPVAAAMAGVSYGVLRLGWRMRSLWWERHLQQKIEELSSTVQDITIPVEDPSGDEP